ncbi:M6 family metalloprotease domain-containing protein [Candidatus Bathyarchaeota archaeon]|nr:M6 family metalloprotease domain-containing protein [Candidatus Bathyarchaeota archaeon]
MKKASILFLTLLISTCFLSASIALVKAVDLSSTSSINSRITSGPQSIIVILVKFRDLENVKTQDEIKDLVFNKLNEYFKEVSYGNITLIGDVTPVWYTLKSVKYYGSGREKLESLISDAVKAADKDVDFRNYQYIMVVHAGDNQDKSGNPNDITSFSSKGNKYPVTTMEGKLGFGVLCLAELDPLGPYAHYLARTFGLPRLYNIEKITSEGYDDYVGEWDLMAHGLWANNGSTPVHPSAWSKLQLGCIPENNIIEVKDGFEKIFKLTAHEALSQSNIHAIKIPLTNKTYYLIEARAKTGFDKYLPDEGVLIFYVNESKVDGKGILKVIDAHPETETLNDAALKPGDIFQASKLTIEVLSALNSTYLVRVDRTGKPIYVNLTVNASYPNATIKIDNKPFLADSKGLINVTVRIGNHTIEASKEIYVKPDVKAVFSGWSDGDKNNPKTFYLNNSISLTALYKLQYFLKVESLELSFNPSGWYNENSKVQVSVNPVIDYGNGTKALFSSWIGSINSSESSIEVLMDSPKNLTASWKIQKKIFFTIEGLSNGTKIELTVNNKIYNYTVPFNHSEWVDENSIVEFDVSPKIFFEGLNIYEFKFWRSSLTGNASSPLKIKETDTITGVYAKNEASLEAKFPEISLSVPLKSSLSFPKTFSLNVLYEALLYPFKLSKLTAIIIAQSLIFNPFLANLASAITSSFLIGLIYFTPITFLTLYLIKKKTRKTLKFKHLTLIIGVLALSLIISLIYSSYLGLTLASIASITISALIIPTAILNHK